MRELMKQGSDHIDLPACARRNILVTNVPAASIESVAEHALALFFALRRNVVGMHQLTVGTDEWVKKWSLKNEFGGCPGTCREEVVGILGRGELGLFFLSLVSFHLFFSFRPCFSLLFFAFWRTGKARRKSSDIHVTQIQQPN
jgi:lactate dehydrogenase-like 2-hydroxyacid dehydrogenase